MKGKKMKNVWLTTVMVIMVVSAGYANELETAQYGPILVATADSNAAALSVSTSSWAVCKNWVDVPRSANGLEVMFYAYSPTGPNNLTFSYEFYVAKYGCNAQKVAAGTATVGASQISHNPVTLRQLNSGAVDPNYCWVDTLGTITTDWKDGGVKSQNDGGADDVASFIFDRQSARKTWCRIYNRSSATMVVYCIAYGY